MASVLVLKYKEWADFQMHIAIVITKGISGVVFRYVDEFNFYFIEIS